MRCVKIAVIKSFSEGSMTSKQKERFIKHFFKRNSLRQIAEEEGVHFWCMNVFGGQSKSSENILMR